MATSPQPTTLDEISQSLNMATPTSAAPGDERNGLELNGHVSPAHSQPDATNATKSSTDNAAPLQNQLKNTDASNKDAFASNQSVSAMTPPSADNVTSADAPTDSAPTESHEVKDTEMADAPTDSAKPPSPPAEPVADAPAVPDEKPVEKSTEKPAESDQADEPSAKPAHSSEAAEATAKDEPASHAVTEPGTNTARKIDTQTTTSSEALPSDLMTPTVPMSEMALDASQEAATASSTVDTSMTDAPSQNSTKVARERDEDDDEEPAAKRARTSGEQDPPAEAIEAAPSTTSDAMVVDKPADVSEAGPASASAPASEAQPASTGSPVSLSVDGRARKLNDPALANNPITVYQNREIRKVLGLVKKTKSGQHFRQPVQVLWPTVWDQYRQLIARPVDISFIEQNLRDGKYDTIGQFRRDVELLQANATTFNGATHDVTNWAKSTVSQIYERLAAIPAEEPAKPVKQEPKQMPTRHAEPRHPPAPKKEARPPAPSPVEKSSTDSQIYALLPSGLPNIRRDSTKNDGDRPKRPIHPPKNKDIGFQPKTTKNKKKPELRFCDEVMKDIISSKNWVNNQWFMEAVDPVALNIPTYHSVVKQPMDLGTMKDKLQRGEYESAKDFKSDFGLIVKNCVKFNGEDHPVTAAAKELEQIFEKKWSEKASWLSKHAQTSAPPVAATSPRGGAKEEDTEEDEASEAEPQDSASPDVKEIQRSIDALSSRLKQERAELDKKLMSNNPDKLDIDMHQGIINHLQSQMVDKRQALNKATETKKASQPKAPKKKATGGAANSGASASKKGGGAQAGPKKAAGGGATTKKPVKKKLNEEEKEIVSEAIARLEANALDKAIAIIKKDTGLKETEDDELELDMDQLSDDALVKLFDLVIKAFPSYKEQLKKLDPAPTPVHSASTSKSTKPKKNKPMGKAEQERKLEQLRELKNSYKRPGSGSQEPLPSVENNDANLAGNQPDDSDDASSSEEE